jgi:hypothetical protein
VCNLQAPLGYATVISKSYNTHTHTLIGLILGIQNHLGGGPVVRAWTKRFAPSVVLGSSPVVAHMMAIGGLHGR